ncbi:hydratase [Amphritea balenae]|uniref:Hydratase n=1 Tax=Amphritea balenae TaxID=452629 RepID=A0A3P1SQE3_9GAMM|nr:hydratase [Amphritea balenae]RRC99310.1 hydratase [Amphritea balenae]GGK72125.1 hydratase [Amphritea balenae]
MQREQVKLAAELLIQRRLSNQLTARLDKVLRPETVEQALAIQQQLINQMPDTVGGWKTALPISDSGMNDLPVVAPIFSNTVYDRSPCPIHLDEGVCKIEPEIAFRFQHDLPARNKAYSDQEITEALSGAHLSLELIQNRYLQSEEAGFLEHLADCLFNQGLYIGPEISLDQAFSASHIDLTLTRFPDASDTNSPAIEVLAGIHPNQYPQLPLFWLVIFLSQRGIDIKAGQYVITSSYAGVIEVSADQEFSLEYGDLGSVLLHFDLK